MAERLSRRRKDRGAPGLKQLPWGQPVNRRRPLELLDEDDVERIHLASMRIVEDHGLKFLDAEARSRLKAAGCDVDEATRTVRFDRGFIAEQVAKAPSSFTLHARNPARDVVIGDGRVAVQVTGGPPFCSDLDAGRRDGTIEDARNFVKLGQALNTVHVISTRAVDAMDVAPLLRHLAAFGDAMALTDKVSFCSLLGRFRAADSIDMACIAHGLTRDDIRHRPIVAGNVNTNSPLMFDGPMAQGAIEMAEAGQAVVVTPFTLSGAMSPATVAAALAQQNAEALAVIAFLQTVNPGTPCVYGSFTSNVDMRTGAPAFGTPEYAKAVLASGQLGRRYGLPVRCSNVNASNAVDAQAAYESQMSLWPIFMGGISLVMQGLGWLEGGLVASYEKVILDAEMLQMMSEVVKPLDMSGLDSGLEAIAEVGPGGHFFGAADTMARYETAFYSPMLSDWRNFETWSEDGAKDAAMRANAIWKRILADFEAPGLDPARAEQLDAFRRRRAEELADYEEVA